HELAVRSEGRTADVLPGFLEDAETVDGAGDRQVERSLAQPERGRAFATGHVPDADDLTRAHGQALAVGAEGEVLERGLVVGKPPGVVEGPFLAGGQVPQADDGVEATSRGEDLSIRAEGYLIRTAGSPVEDGALLRRGHVPQPNRPVLACRRQRAAVRAEG